MGKDSKTYFITTTGLELVKSFPKAWGQFIRVGQGEHLEFVVRTVVMLLDSQPWQFEAF